MNMKTLGLIGLALAGGLVVVLSGARQPDLPQVHVYKSATCGCCANWVDHLEAAGFEVTVEDVADVNAVKRRLGVPSDLASCHTATVGDYLVEGHVPAQVVKRLLDESPQVAGLAVPGMPIGSPGMEGPNPRPYDVMAFDADANRGVFQHIVP